MIRVLLLTVVPLILPTLSYVLWRTFVPPKFGGSEAIAQDQWEPMPWRWLCAIGGALMAITLTVAVIFPDFLSGI